MKTSQCKQLTKSHVLPEGADPPTSGGHQGGDRSGCVAAQGAGEPGSPSRAQDTRTKPSEGDADEDKEGRLLSVLVRM